MTEFRRFGRDELEGFLRLVDAKLEKDATVVILGGAAASLWGATFTTSDIDVWSADAEFWTACEAVRHDGVRLPIGPAAIAQPPHDFEDRLERLPVSALHRLTVAAPEAHDWAITKIARGEQHDLEHIAWLHGARPLDLAILIERFRKTDQIGSRRMFELSFLNLVERLFGSEGLPEVEAAIQS